MRYCLLIASCLLLASPSLADDKPLDLSKVLKDEVARRTALAEAQQQARVDRNAFASRQLMEQQKTERSKLIGKAVEGEVIVDAIGRGTDSKKRNYVYVRIQVGEPKQRAKPSTMIEARTSNLDDPVIAALKKGDRVLIRGTIGDNPNLDRILNCTFKKP